MAKNKKHIYSKRDFTTGEVCLTEQDLAYAQDLLDWSRGLDTEKILWEDWEKRVSESRSSSGQDAGLSSL